MRTIRYGLFALGTICCLATAAHADFRIGFGIGIDTPGMSIRVNVPAYPELVPVPGYPVYYAPRLGANYFFYDGLYWVYLDDFWYASDWYNGPWWRVTPDYVPVFVLRVPVAYYRSPPPYFYGWPANHPPRWGDRWGDDWKHRHRDWDRWDYRNAPPPAPVPHYQRNYSGKNYPHRGEQEDLHRRNYRDNRNVGDDSPNRQPYREMRREYPYGGQPGPGSERRRSGGDERKERGRGGEEPRSQKHGRD